MNPLLIRRCGMMAAQQGGLPYDAEIEYLESSGTQWIDTLYYPNTLTIMNSELMLKPNNALIAYCYCDEDHQQGTVGINVGGSGTNLNVSMYYNTGSQRAIFQTIPINVKCTLDVLNNSARLNNTEKPFIRGTFSSFYPLCLFGNPNSSVKGASRIYTFTIFENGIAKRDLIPVRVGTTGYMYDRVSGQLFGNQGTGNFVLGPDKA